MYSLTSRFTAFRNLLAGRLSRFVDADQEGQGMVEYAFIVVLIALIVIVVIVLIGNQTKNMWSDITVQFH